MTKYQEKIYNIQTGETIFRDFTPEEVAELEAEMEAIQSAAEAAAAEAAAKAAARQALLDRLGITAEEAQLLLGSN